MVLVKHLTFLCTIYLKMHFQDIEKNLRKEKKSTKFSSVWEWRFFSWTYKSFQRQWFNIYVDFKWVVEVEVGIVYDRKQEKYQNGKVDKVESDIGTNTFGKIPVSFSFHRLQFWKVFSFFKLTFFFPFSVLFSEVFWTKWSKWIFKLKYFFYSVEEFETFPL